LRTNPVTVQTQIIVTHQAIPLVFAVVLFFAMAYSANSFLFAILSNSGYVCRPDPEKNLRTLAVGSKIDVEFATSHACFPTGIQLEAAAKYRIKFSDEDSVPWKDGDIKVKGRQGYGSLEPNVPRYMILGAPMRRIASEKWFRPVARIGSYQKEEHLLGPHSTIVEARRTGELFLYVNDAVLGLPEVWDLFYRNNEGYTRVTIEKIDDPATF
jgi:hypothetical protein